MFCPHCGKQIPEDAVFCKYCGQNVTHSKSNGASFREDEEGIADFIEVEGKKQLGGIEILLWVFVSLRAFFYLLSLVMSCSMIIEGDFGEGAGLFILYTIIFGGFSLLEIFALVGLKNRKPYTVPLVRTILVLWCFNLIGLILVLTIFWKRINHEYSKLYLNYHD